MKNKSPLNRILAPVDYSDASLQVLPIAESLADSANIELHLLHVNQPAIVYAHPGGAVAPMGASAMATPTMPTQAQLEAKLRDETQLNILPESRVKRAVVEGSPTEAIVSYAENNGINLIVMTTHGNTGLTR